MQPFMFVFLSMFTMFIHVVVGIGTSFFFMAQ